MRPSRAPRPPRGAAASSVEAGKLEDVVVTAQRREESAQNVGIALSVLTPSTLAEGGVDKVNGLANVTPSLEVEPAFGSGQPQFRLRGVGFIDYTSNNTSAVGVTVGDVALPFPVQTQGQLFDVARVEVLRGPQGTLYGRNTTAGAVNFIVNRPGHTAEGGLSLNYGSYGEFTAEGFISGPLAEGVLGRLSVATEQGGAWQWNRLSGQKLGDKNKLAARGQLEWDPTDAIKLRLTVHASTDKSDAYGAQLISPFTTPGGSTIPADTNPHATGWSLNPAFAQFVGLSPNSKPGLDDSNHGADLNATFDLGSVTLTSITAYDKLARKEFGDWDATQFSESDIYFNDEIKVFSEEARIASKGHGPVDWVAGVYYSNEKLFENFYGDFTDIYGASALTTYHQEGKSLGLFGQLEGQISDRLRGTLGLRHEHETRDLIGLNTLFGGFPLNGPPANRSLSNDDYSGKAELDFQLDKGVLLYGSVSRGVKSGGFTAHNTTSTNPTILDPFLPERLTAYELGVKADVAATVRLNAAVFYYDYRDQQILSKYQDSVTGSYIGRFINAPKSRIEGAEAELTWLPGNGLEISQYLGYKSGKFTALVLNSSLVDFNGKDLDFPKLSYGGQFAYGWSWGGYKLRAETNYSFHDKYDQLFLLENVDAGGIVGPPQFQIDSYWLANASVALLPAAGKSWQVSVWGHNITNERYYVTKNFFLPQNNIGAAGKPATVGVRLDWSF